MATPSPLLHPISTVLRLILIIFLSVLTMISSTDAFDPQLIALLAVAKAIGHPKNLTQSWQGEDFCHNWEFITCTPERNVTIINFEKQHLSGTISPAFANLTSLTSLRLNDNNLTGSIPDVLATLPRLEFLDVSNNNLSGKVPVFPSTVKFLAAGNDHLLLGRYSANGSGEESNESYKWFKRYVIMIGVVTLLDFVGAVLVLCNIVKKQHQIRSWGIKNAALMVISVEVVALFIFVGVLFLVSYNVMKKQQMIRYSGETTLAEVTNVLGLLDFVGAQLVVGYNWKKQYQRSGEIINAVVMVISVAAGAVLVVVGLLLLVSNHVNPLQQRCSGENTVLVVTAFVALLVFVGAVLLRNNQKSWWINAVLMVSAVGAFLVFVGIIIRLLLVIQYFKHCGV